MKNLLRHDNLWYTIVTYSERDVTDSVSPMRRYKKALSKINLMIETNCLSHVMQAETATEACEALEKAFEDKDLNRKVRLMRSIFSV